MEKRVGGCFHFLFEVELPLCFDQIINWSGYRIKSFLAAHVVKSGNHLMLLTGIWITKS
jgi:hypothetical protein